MPKGAQGDLKKPKEVHHTCPRIFVKHIFQHFSYFPTYSYFSYGYLDTNPINNPLSYNWNTIYVRYCDCSSFVGNNDTITNVTYNNQTYYSTGIRSVQPRNCTGCQSTDVTNLSYQPNNIPINLSSNQGLNF